MIYLKTDEEIELMRAANQLVGRTLAEVAKIIAPGVSTKTLDKRAEEFIRDHGATPAFLGYQGFPGSMCISVNDQVVHGIPSHKTILQEGDIVTLDCGTKLAGFTGDSAYTFAVGEISEEVHKLLKTTKVQRYCEARGYHVVRELTGHGIGVNLHESPEVPNYGKRGTGTELRNGMCICIEPMINIGSKNVVQERDGWTIRTKTRKPSAHFEHCVAIRDGKADILSSFDFIAEVLGDREF